MLCAHAVVYQYVNVALGESSTGDVGQDESTNRGQLVG